MQKQAPHSSSYNVKGQQSSLNNYYSNIPYESKHAAQIKRVRSSENIPLMPSNRQIQNFGKASSKVPVKQENTKKPALIEPGKQLNETFQEVLSTTTITENNVTTYFIAKALKGPMLKYASQECNKKQPSKKPNKKMPEVNQGICGSMQPHLEGYSTITHEGLYRSSNEDKITICLEQNAKWFSVYDGHGGSMCSQFLKDHLHEYFFKQKDWKADVPNALRKSFLKTEQEWKAKGDNSGSCAIVVFIYGNMCYTANLGDSRAILGSENCTKCYQISKDHKPSNFDEQNRIIKAGGKIYQTTAVTEAKDETGQVYYDQIVGPLRVFPGRLSTTRTFGDFEAKQSTNSKIVICEPQITSFQIDEHDFIFIASDGLWDRIENRQVTEAIKSIMDSGLEGEQLYQKSTQSLLMQSMLKGSSDNISIILVGLNDPKAVKETKSKGNEHIKIMSSIGAGQRKHKKNIIISDKENMPERMKELDNKISEINKNAAKILHHSRQR